MARRLKTACLLGLLVLAGHALLLDWLANQWRPVRPLEAMPPVMFTRTLRPAEPAAAPPPARKAQRQPRPQLASIPAQPAPAVEPAAAAAEPPPVADAPATPQAGSTTVAALTPGATAEPAGPPLSANVATAPPLPAPTPALTPAPAGAPGAPAATPLSAPAATPTPTPTPTSTATREARPSAADLSSWPVNTRLRYRLTGYWRGDITGNARVQWQRDGQRYQVEIEIGFGVGSVLMTSQGKVLPERLEPEVYEEQLLNRRRPIEFRAETIRLADGEIRERPDGVQDTASQFVEMSHRFSREPAALREGAVVRLTMARPGGIDHWVYDVAAPEILDLRLDHVPTPVSAYRLTPRPLPGRENYIYQQVWYAPALLNLPVRIRVDLGDHKGHVQLDVIGIDQQ